MNEELDGMMREPEAEDRYSEPIAVWYKTCRCEECGGPIDKK